MNRFIKRVFLFLVPVLIVVLPPAFVFVYSEESDSGKQELLDPSKPYIVGFRYHEFGYRELKWSALNEGGPYDVVTLGTSRVLKFRQKMFDSSFYNAGYVIRSIYDYGIWLKALPSEKLPSCLMLGLDHWFFQEENHPRFAKTMSIPNGKNNYNVLRDPSAYLDVWHDLIVGNYGLTTIVRNKNDYRIGLNAVLKNAGFRSDGSLAYNTRTDGFEEIGQESFFGHRKTNDGNDGAGYLIPSKTISAMSLNIIDSLLRFCKVNKIAVVGFLPPFADSTLRNIRSLGGYEYMNVLYDSLYLLFKQYNYEFYDFTDPSYFGSSDEEFLDGLHGGEVTYQRVLLECLKNGSLLKKYSKPYEVLERELNNRVNARCIYVD